VGKGHRPFFFEALRIEGFIDPRSGTSDAA
jgi:hypothetical protein